MIRWKKEDYITLRKAINNFNKIVKKNKTIENELYLPELKSYKETKANILTRKEFNNVINSLNQINKKGALDITKLGNEFITRYEKHDIIIKRRRAISRLNQELEEFDDYLGTGNTRKNEIKSTIKRFEELELKEKKSFRNTVKSIENQGRSDFLLMKKLVFQKNFISAYSKLNKGTNNSYKEILKIAKNTDAERFWEIVKDTELVDLQERYDVNAGIITVGLSNLELLENEMIKINNLLTISEIIRFGFIK